MSLPSPEIIRDRISHIKDESMRNCLATAYLYAGRISEVIGVASPSDQTTARGPTNQDARLDTYINGDVKEPCVVFTVRTAKREGKQRLIALPINYEPWAKPLYNYYKSVGGTVYPFTRQKVSMYVKDKKVFEGLQYPIETYSIWEDGSVTKKVDSHMKPFTLHALRHLRATELVEYYGFDGRDLATYGGWTFRSFGYPATADRYLSMGWQGYFPKLLKKK